MKKLIALLIALVFVPAQALADLTADFTVSPAAPTVGVAATFTSTGECTLVPPCRYQWTWYRTNGTTGGQMGEGTTVTYTFTSVGAKRVVLKVTNSSSTHKFTTATQVITVG